MSTPYSRYQKKPAFRKLRAYAFDPSLSLKADTADINLLVYKVPWEDLRPGPIGEYVEVIDYDPSVKTFYEPVDLENHYILAEDGLDPSESNPQFHQQMVYAVAMTTIRNFEKALGRKVLWAPRLLDGNGKYEEYVGTLRIYPHALREANAYYSPQKKALLFGYFSATPANNLVMMPDSLVFTCLSHDVIAHEVTHAILDGMHYFYNEPTNPDVLAFHEAFADIVALFQHFTFPEVLKHQIAQTKGDLTSQNLLGQLAQEFGSAIGSYGSLRDAIGKIDPKTKKWQALEPRAEDYHRVMEPHARGSILVAAVFEAFLNIYKRRIADLLRLSTNGTGILPQGELHPDLVNRLAQEAAKSARHVLNMCIRALDYCPPVDITFGDYLRAIITADSDLIVDDAHEYRLSFIDAFRRRGIYPTGIRALSVESLRYNQEPIRDQVTKDIFEAITEFLRDYRDEVIYEKDRQEIYKISRRFISGSGRKQGLHRRIFTSFTHLQDSVEFERLTGLVFNSQFEAYGVRSSKTYTKNPAPSFQIQNLRLVSRVGPDGSQINQIVFNLVQRIGVIVQNGQFKETFVPRNEWEEAEVLNPLSEMAKSADGCFEFRGGCTLIFDLDTLKLRYAISKPILCPDGLQRGARLIDTDRVLKQYRYQQEEGLLSFGEQALFFGTGLNNILHEPFALLHKH